MRLTFALLAAVALHAQAPDDFRTWMDRGIEAYKTGRYPEAAAAFENAVLRNPSDPNAHLFVGNACMAAWTPRRNSPENGAWADKAEREFQTVLALDAENESALASLGSLTLQQKRFDDAEGWYGKLLHRGLAAGPTSPAALRDAHFALGVILWSRWRPEYDAARKRFGMRPEDPGPLPDPGARRTLMNRWGPGIDEALAHLRSAWAGGKAEAPAYISRLIRERADLRDSQPEYRRDLREADDWASRRPL
ncbi:MAG: tetratricopeptide repeat protein [Acidobacteriia bacterium]|nr:tetratricopeptide repeat protein [Terriglobia bacterium]